MDLGIARDTEGDTEACFARAIDQGADVLITSGEPAIRLAVELRGQDTDC